MQEACRKETGAWHVRACTPINIVWFVSFMSCSAACLPLFAMSMWWLMACARLLTSFRQPHAPMPSLAFPCIFLVAFCSVGWCHVFARGSVCRCLLQVSHRHSSQVSRLQCPSTCHATRPKGIEYCSNIIVSKCTVPLNSCARSVLVLCL